MKEQPYHPLYPPAGLADKSQHALVDIEHALRSSLRFATLTATGFAIAILVALVLAGSTLWSTASRFADYAPAQPSRLYSRPLVLEVGMDLGREETLALLADLQIRPAADEDALVPGTYRELPDALTIRRRSFPSLGGTGREPEAIIKVAFKGDRLRQLWLDGRSVEKAQLGAKLLATYYDDDLRECRPVQLAALPPHVVRAFLAAEDAEFFDHFGVSPFAVLRAAWVNLRAGSIRQGGSTITQQLVKNLFLTSERTFARKGREAIVAMLLEARYSKQAILEAYLNELYFGAQGPVNIIGLGAASIAFFGKEPQYLTPGEAALLAGMVPAPSRFDPRRHPDAVRHQRDLMLARLDDQGWIAAGVRNAALETPVKAHPMALEGAGAPFFADAVRIEIESRYGLDEEALRGGGYTLFSTLDWRDQRAAEAAVSDGLAALEKSSPRLAGLEAALVSVDPDSGAMRAYVGGRDYQRSQFDRVRQAHRQAGSVFKPIIFATAFDRGVALPADLVSDTPIVLRYGEHGRREWQPRNDDRRFRGEVTVRAALERSLNVPTVRLALATGLDEVRSMAQQMGVESPVPLEPSLALGALETSPRDLAAVYATLASGGVWCPLYGLRGVRTAGGVVVLGNRLPEPQRVLRPDTAYLTTSLLRGVIDHGTGARARRMGVKGVLAGKTGTSNDARDNWFAGYGPDRATVVWVGFDDNRATGLSGSRGALPLWSRFVRRVMTSKGLDTEMPDSVVEVWIDPTTGLLAGPHCPHRVREVFPVAQAPETPCRHEPPIIEIGSAYDLLRTDEERDDSFDGGTFFDEEDGEQALEEGEILQVEDGRGGLMELVELRAVQPTTDVTAAVLAAQISGE